MVKDETLFRLRFHAGLETADGGECLSIALCTLKNSRCASKIGYAMIDFIAALSELNHEVNGAVPSRSTASDENLPRKLVYAVTEALRLLREYQESRRGEVDGEKLAREVWRAETAWLAVLAGDIDDVEQFLEAEEVME